MSQNDGLPSHFGNRNRFSGGSSHGRAWRGRGGPARGGRRWQHGAGQPAGRQYPQRVGSRPRHRLDDDRIEQIGSINSGCPSITIAVEGCCHGQLDAIYDRILKHQQDADQKVDLLICCGDFQSLRNMADFHSLAVPPKYRSLGDFHAYYSGSKLAPIPTIFIGGNHEASQPLQELPYGGWVAPNIYYLGWAGLVNFGGVRIGGISGIFKSHDYAKGHHELPPFDRDTLRSVYHVRNVDVYRMLSLSRTSRRVDVMVSHDWPLGIEQFGDTDRLLRNKPFFRQEIERNELGSPPNREILDHLQPRYWFSAHLHTKFHATIQHGTLLRAAKESSITTLVPSQTIKPQLDYPEATEKTTHFIATETTDPCPGPDLTQQMTQFLSLDKCLPRRSYLSIVHVPVNERPERPSLEYDLEWLTVLAKTHDLTRLDSSKVTLPEEHVSVTSEEMAEVGKLVGPSLAIPTNFEMTVPPHLGPVFPLPHLLPPPLPRQGNPQTDALLRMLDLQHITTIPSGDGGANVAASAPAVFEDENEIDLDEHVDDERDSSLDSKRPRVGSSCES